jgi:hypothetical protein
LQIQIKSRLHRRVGKAMIGGNQEQGAAALKLIDCFRHGLLDARHLCRHLVAATTVHMAK